MRRLAALAISLGIAAAPGTRQPVDEAQPAAAEGAVVVEVPAGRVRVFGWDRGEVRVTGTLGRGAERLDLRRAGERTTVKVVAPRGEEVEGSDIDIRVPTGSRVAVETVSADVSAEGLFGVVDVETVSGRATVDGEPTSIDVATVSGDVKVRARARRVRCETVSGTIDIVCTGGEVAAESVSGDLTVTGSALSGVRLSSTSGPIRFEGDLAPEGVCDAESVSGPVELRLPADVDADLVVKTFSGSIMSDFGGKAVRTGAFGPARELRFRAGGGRASVSARTFSGTIRVRTR